MYRGQWKPQEIKIRRHDSFSRQTLLVSVSCSGKKINDRPNFCEFLEFYERL